MQGEGTSKSTLSIRFACHARALARLKLRLPGPAGVPKSRFPPLEVFGRRPPQLAAPSDAAGVLKPSKGRQSGQGAPRVRSVANTRLLAAPRHTAASCQQQTFTHGSS